MPTSDSHFQTDLILCTKAAAYAVERHRTQRRPDPDKTPYANHLAEVALTTAEHGGDAAAVCAAWLHDLLEDQCPDAAAASAAEAWILSGLAPIGGDVLEAVRELTDPPEWSVLPKIERKRLQAEHIQNCGPRARLVKIADQTSNMRATGRALPNHWDGAKAAGYVAGSEPRRPAVAEDGIKPISSADSFASLRRI